MSWLKLRGVGLWFDSIACSVGELHSAPSVAGLSFQHRRGEELQQLCLLAEPRCQSWYVTWSEGSGWSSYVKRGKKDKKRKRDGLSVAYSMACMFKLGCLTCTAVVWCLIWLSYQVWSAYVPGVMMKHSLSIWASLFDICYIHYWQKVRDIWPSD